MKLSDREDGAGASTGLITVLGIGCSLYCDQGFGVAVVQHLEQNFRFPDHVCLVDGGLIGVGLTGLIARSAHLIAVDAFHNNGQPGDIFRLDGNQIFQRFKTKNQIQHVEFLEALAHCQALDNPPRAVLLGIEPEDTKTVVCTLTPALQKKMETVMEMVLSELDRLSVTYSKKEATSPCV
jgi:hydrogenase maturation protease